MVQFHENWYPDDKKQVLCRLAQKAMERCPIGAFVEVGVFEGRSTLALAQTIAPRTLHVIDHWLGDTDNPAAIAGREGINPASLNGRDVYAQFMANVQASRLTNIEVHRGDWREVTDGVHMLVAFVHLDASHNYESVRDQIATFRRRTIDGAIMVGDDWLHAGTARAVMEAFGQPNVIGNLWWVYL